MCLTFYGDSEMEGCTHPLIGSGPDSPSVRLHDRAGNSQTHARPLWLRSMERFKNPFATFRRQPYAGIADRNDQLSFGIRSRSTRQLASSVFHGLDRIQDQVHEHLLKLHPVCQDVRQICLEVGMDSDRVSNSFGPEQGSHFPNDVFDVHHLALRGSVFLVEGPQTVDNIGCTVSVLLNSSCCRAGPLQVGRITCKPSQTGVRAGDRGGDGLFDFVRQRRGHFSHYVHAVDMCEVSLRLAQLFTLLLCALSFRYVHRNPDVFTDFSRGIVVSHGTQESDGAVWAINPIFEVVIYFLPGLHHRIFPSERARLPGESLCKSVRMECRVSWDRGHRCERLHPISEIFSL